VSFSLLNKIKERESLLNKYKEGWVSLSTEGMKCRICRLVC